MNGIILGLFLAVSAQAQSLDVGHEELQRTLLLEAITGDYDSAILSYERLVRSRAATGEVRAQALYRLGAARYAIGDRDGAVEALLKGIRTGECGPACHLMLGQIKLETESVRTIPTRWTFTDGNPGIFHPWEFDQKGSIRIQTAAESPNPALIWETIVDVQSGDSLTVGFRAPSPVPSRISFKMQADGRAGSVRVRVLDVNGQEYQLDQPVFRITTEEANLIVVVLDKLVPVSPGDPEFVPAEISALFIDDVSARNGTAPGPNRLYLDDFSVD